MSMLKQVLIIASLLLSQPNPLADAVHKNVVVITTRLPQRKALQPLVQNVLALDLQRLGVVIRQINLSGRVVQTGLNTHSQSVQSLPDQRDQQAKLTVALHSSHPAVTFAAGSPVAVKKPASVIMLQNWYVPLGGCALPHSSTGGSLSQLDPWNRSDEFCAGYMYSPPAVPFGSAAAGATLNPCPYAATASTILSAGTPAASHLASPASAEPWLLRGSQAERSGALGPAVAAQAP